MSKAPGAPHYWRHQQDGQAIAEAKASLRSAERLRQVGVKPRGRWPGHEDGDRLEPASGAVAEPGPGVEARGGGHLCERGGPSAGCGVTGSAAGAAESILRAAPHQNPLNPVPLPTAAGTPAYLVALYAVPLLSPDQEVHHFRKMNYLKFRAARALWFILRHDRHFKKDAGPASMEAYLADRNKA